ncbi:MAG TPA: VOC family protein [Bryobacteraceae bacterium]|nr:VOC family protein [Bryobacteraceae bacterium]
MKTSRLAVLLALAALPAISTPPQIYQRIGHVFWVVRHLDGPLEGWSKLCLSDVQAFGRVEFRGDEHGRAVSGHARMAWGHLGNLAVDMLEPERGDPAFDNFLASHGDGIFAIVYEAADRDVIKKEVQRLQALGVPVLEHIRIETGRGPADFTFFDSEPKGKYVLGLVNWPGGAAPKAAPETISHIAFVIREARPVSDYWQHLGFPAMPVAQASPRADSRYHGMPLLLSFDVGWHRYSQPTFEWIIPPQDPPNCYADFLKAHGEGVHHLGMPVEDLNRAIAEYKALGYSAVQSGAWGDVGKPGSGQYAYMSTDSIGGVTVELIHAYR